VKNKGARPAVAFSPVHPPQMSLAGRALALMRGIGNPDDPESQVRLATELLGNPMCVVDIKGNVLACTRGAFLRVAFRMLEMQQ